MRKFNANIKKMNFTYVDYYIILFVRRFQLRIIFINTPHYTSWKLILITGQKTIRISNSFNEKRYIIRRIPD